MQTCVAALRLPGRMSVERVAGCWWTGWPDGVECALNDDGSVTVRWEQQEIEAAERGEVEFEQEEEAAPF